MNQLRYQMIIIWSDENDCYLVHFPDFPEQKYRTHGDTYEEAARNGQEVLELLLQEDGLPHPKPLQVA
ncbi:MAG: type II toxin-antitoxin system HicB family antitoxin [Pseudanabaena sp. RU_4_16]|jgi:predicted RNase H-like HicB family nuclease|nr:type II toxin-antitoxin system HicB family antitoxin [Pseudanabaena sp. RU_4_16]